MSEPNGVAAATPPLQKEKLLILLPVAPDPDRIARIKARHPRLEIQWLKTNDANAKPINVETLPAETWENVTLLLGSGVRPPPAHLIPAVRFVQLTAAGVDKWLEHKTYQDQDVVFCSANGVHPPQIAEWVIGTWLSHQHHFMRYADHMKTGFWEPPYVSTVQDSAGARMGILGYGAIGRQCARVASAMGMEVYAYTRSERTTPEARKDDSYCVPGTGDPDGLIPARWFSGTSRDAINDFLGQDFDILVISLPLTEETRGIISREQFEILSKHRKTFLSNIARGGHVDQEALIEALEKGLIRGAAIDVTSPEPLPSDHPLWKAPNLLITPHVSWQTTKYFDRVLDILEVNLGRMEAGQPLINRVNRQLHY